MSELLKIINDVERHARFIKLSSLSQTNAWLITLPRWRNFGAALDERTLFLQSLYRHFESCSYASWDAEKAMPRKVSTSELSRFSSLEEADHGWGVDFGDWVLCFPGFTTGNLDELQSLLRSETGRISPQGSEAITIYSEPDNLEWTVRYTSPENGASPVASR